MNTNKHNYAEVFTPLSLVKEITSLLSFDNLRIYEPGVGKGVFLSHIKTIGSFASYEGCEINPDLTIIEQLNKNSNVDIKSGDFFNQKLKTYDLIIGNPPFYQDGFKGPPCSKTRKGTTIWPQIVKKCFEHLSPNGIMALIIPCIWLKPDKEKIYDLFINKILFLKIYSCVESNKLFGYKAQTPCCYVIVQKNYNNDTFMLNDNNVINQTSITSLSSDYLKNFNPFTLKKGYCIPTINSQLIQDFIPFVTIKPIKIAKIDKNIYPIIKNPTKYYPIITTYKDTFYGFESLEPGLYQGIPKIIIAHKTKPIPLLDISGTYGVYGRDKYVILGTNLTNENLKEQYEYLLLPIVQTILKSFTVRMNFIEKDIFKYISKE
uniref:Type II methyltransferase M.TaqI-like domain-containing protein n=1 Tax=viral metagenome TaxID=1070528 RepID=A0A6C0EV33_9ZZZZ